MDPRDAGPQLQYLHNKLRPLKPPLSGSDRLLRAHHAPGVSLYRFGFAEYAEYGVKGNISWEGAGSSSCGLMNRLDSLQTYLDNTGLRAPFCALSMSPDVSRSMQLTCWMPWHTSPKSSLKAVSRNRSWSELTLGAVCNSWTPRELLSMVWWKSANMLLLPEHWFMLLSGEDTESKPSDTDTALLSSAVVGQEAQVSAVSARSFIKEFDISSKLERKAIFRFRQDSTVWAVCWLHWETK